ncbi:MAG: FHA domain-containing protein [Clostridia bacterium]|nr:FHA domain-containing protein [Clostridia bacterium]
MKRISNLGKLFGMLCLVALMICTMAVGVSAAKFSNADDSVVAVISEYGTKYATGVAIGPKGKDPAYILTSYGVLDSASSKNAMVYFSFEADKSVVATVHYSNADMGIVVLRLPERTSEVVPAVFASSNKVTTDSELRGICYPDDINWLQNSYDIIRPGISLNKLDRRNDCDVFEVTATTNKITAGCPVVNNKGEVVGIFVDAYKGHVLTSEEIMEVLDNEKLSYAKAGIDTMLLIIIGAAVLVVVIILVVVLVIVSSKKKNKAAAGVAGGEAIPSQPVNAGAYVQNNTVPVATPASMRLVCRGGALNGNTYTVSGTSKIGRDASKCEIAYPVNTQGVSGCHCELTFDGTVCYLKDIGSSYGTFLSNGTKLAPHAPQLLRSGDTFYLAAPENTFEVRF